MIFFFRVNSFCGCFWMNRMISVRIRILFSIVLICGLRILFVMLRLKVVRMLLVSWLMLLSIIIRKELMM